MESLYSYAGEDIHKDGASTPLVHRVSSHYPQPSQAQIRRLAEACEAVTRLSADP